MKKILGIGVLLGMVASGHALTFNDDCFTGTIDGIPATVNVGEPIQPIDNIEVLVEGANGPINYQTEIASTYWYFDESGPVFLSITHGENGNGSFIPEEPIVFNEAGEYTLYVLIAEYLNGCSPLDSTVINVVEQPVEVAIEGPGQVCLGSTYNYALSPSGCGEIESASWFGNNGSDIFDESALSTDITFNAIGEVTLTGTVSSLDVESCQNLSAELVVNVVDGPTLAAELLECEGPHILDAGEGESYQWYKDGLLIEGANSRQLEVAEAGVYSVTVINGDCEFEAETVVKECDIVNPDPTAECGDYGAIDNGDGTVTVYHANLEAFRGDIWNYMCFKGDNTNNANVADACFPSQLLDNGYYVSKRPGAAGDAFDIRFKIKTDHTQEPSNNANYLGGQYIISAFGQTVQPANESCQLIEPAPAPTPSDDCGEYGAIDNGDGTATFFHKDNGYRANWAYICKNGACYRPALEGNYYAYTFAGHAGEVMEYQFKVDIQENPGQYIRTESKVSILENGACPLD